MNFLTNDGIKINYHVKGNGKPLIFVTGFGGHQEIWKLQVDYFLNLAIRLLLTIIVILVVASELKKGTL